MSTGWDSILLGWGMLVLLLSDVECEWMWQWRCTSCRLFTLSSEQDGRRTNMLSFPMVYFISRIWACSSSMKPILKRPLWFIIFTVFFSFCSGHGGNHKRSWRAQTPIASTSMRTMVLQKGRDLFRKSRVKPVTQPKISLCLPINHFILTCPSSVSQLSRLLTARFSTQSSPIP